MTVRIPAGWLGRAKNFFRALVAGGAPIYRSGTRRPIALLAGTTLVGAAVLISLVTRTGTTDTTRAAAHGRPAPRAIGMSSPTPGGTATRRPLRASTRLQGSWVAQFTGSPREITRHGSYVNPIPTGQWTLIFDGLSATLVGPSGFSGPGPGAIRLLAGDRVQFSIDPSCPDQARPTPGIYRYELAGRRLWLIEIGHTDSCPDHVTTLVAHAWTRESPRSDR